ncbi:MAG TPA: serine hydrolase domain-containing protein [Anaerolineales bacterium]|nr:serine hydrolase domain-containing protein [Anaerolineales bacterium]
MLKKILALCLTAILLSEAACASIPKPASTIASDEIADIIAEYREEIPQRMKQEHVPGLAIVVVDDQNILWAEGFGYTDWNRRIPVNADTLFSIQSMSKSFTATAAMFAAQDGLVDLDEPITTYLPDFHVNSIFEENPEQKITLRLLLSHTAGFVHEAPIGGNNDLPGHNFEEHIISISDTWLRFPVGTRWGYSNLGIDLAGYILQVRSGMPFTQYVQEKVLDPLGMTHSTLDIQQVRARSDKAMGHVPMPFRPPVEFLLIPSGGVWTTANDMARYLQFHINIGKLGGVRLLNQDLAETMYEPPNPAALGAEYALGIGTANWQGTRRFQHGGGGFGFNSNMVWYPELKLGAVVLSNADDVGLNMQLVDDVLGSIISADIPLYHSRASTLPSVEPAYGFIQNGPALLTDTALSDLISSKALPLDEASKQRRQNFIGSYVQTKWGVPYIDAQVEERNGIFVLTALGQNIMLIEIQPGLLFDLQGTSYEFPPTVSKSPNYATFKIDKGLLPLWLTFYALCGVIFLSALLFGPIRGIRHKGTSTNEPPRTRWLAWISILSGLASLSSLVCLGIIIFFPNLLYVPWPRPYSDLPWWQFALLSLPFASLVLAFVIALIAGLWIKAQTDGRKIRLYYLGIALALLIFNLALVV